MRRRCASHKKARARAYVLADLFRAVGKASKDLETIAVIVHLLEHGRVRVIALDRKIRACIC
jgi:hypothetical protein